MSKQGRWFDRYLFMKNLIKEEDKVYFIKFGVFELGLLLEEFVGFEDIQYDEEDIDVVYMDGFRGLITGDFYDYKEDIFRVCDIYEEWCGSYKKCDIFIKRK